LITIALIAYKLAQSTKSKKFNTVHTIKKSTKLTIFSVQVHLGKKKRRQRCDSAGVISIHPCKYHGQPRGPHLYMQVSTPHSMKAE